MRSVESTLALPRTGRALVAVLGAALLLLHFALPRMEITVGAGTEDLGFNHARLILQHSSPPTGTPSHYEVAVVPGYLPVQKFSLRVEGCLLAVDFIDGRGDLHPLGTSFDCRVGRNYLLEVPGELQRAPFKLRVSSTEVGSEQKLRLQFYFGTFFNLLFDFILGLGALLLFYLLRREEKFIRYLLPGAFCFYASHFVSLGIDEFAYDFAGHLDHVKVVLQGSLITQKNCWECFQPPLAYWAAALIYRVASIGEALSVAASARLVSLLSFCAMLYYGLKYLALFCEAGRRRNLVALIIVLLPASVSHALRVGNDTLFYAAFMAALFYLTQGWLQNPRALLKFSAFTALALFTKATAFVLYPLAAVLLALPRTRPPWTRLWPLLLALPLFALMQAFKSDMVKRLGELNSQMAVGNRWNNLIGIDVNDLLRFGFTNTWNDPGGRQYFFNFYFKSAFWGEFHWGVDLDLWARGWNIFCFFFFLSLFLHARKVKDNRLRAPLLTMLTGVLATLAFRTYYPLSPMQDFRFLFPVIFPIGVLVLKYSEAISPRYSTGALSVALGILLAIWRVVGMRNF